MVRLILVRHGETPWNEMRRMQGEGTDTELSLRGREQAENLAGALKADTVSAIYSSPLKRALDTARAIARHHQLEVRVLRSLRELDCGEMEGRLLSELRGSFDYYLLRQEGKGLARVPGGESLTELSRRAWRAVQSIAARHPQQSVVVVSHYFVILTILCCALKLPLLQFKRLSLAAAGISILELAEAAPRLVLFNDTCHLTK